jgi:hypothetical protein
MGMSLLRFIERESAAPLVALFSSHVEGALEAFRIKESDQVDRLLAHRVKNHKMKAPRSDVDLPSLCPKEYPSLPLCPTAPLGHRTLSLLASYAWYCVALFDMHIRL